MKAFNKIKLRPFQNILFITVLLMSCKKFVEIPPPTTQLVTSNVFDNNYTATAAVTSIYSSMFGGASTYQIHYYTGLSGDELTLPGPTHLYTNSLNATDDGNSFNVIWNQSYNYIFQANQILENLQNSPNISALVKQQLIGEAKFIRGFWHFYLANLFGDVPIILTTDYRVTSKTSRKPQAAVFQQVISDLSDAQSFLNANFVDATDTTITAERVRPTKWAANAMLARLYLYTGNWTKAEEMANAVINNTSMFSLLTTLGSVFLKNSSETIWQLMAPPGSFYTSEGSSFIITSATPTAPTTGVALNNRLLNAFEPNDKRKVNWIGSYTSGATTFYFPYKYKAGNTSTSITEYEMVLRLAELYLIRAEARAMQDNLQGAIDDVNYIRLKHGGFTTPLTLPSSQSSALNTILRERQVELFTEWGNRWFELRRTGAIDTTMAVATPLKGGIAWQSFQKYYPIPITEIQNNPNMTQTSGY